MIHVYMDDFRRCPQGFTLARTVEECLELLRLTEVDILSLDYDMGPDEPTGTEMRPPWFGKGFPREIYLHTSSITGKKSMYEILYQGLPEQVQLHNGPIPFERLEEIARNCKVPPHSKWICTANHGFAIYAQEELRRMFGSVKSTMLVPAKSSRLRCRRCPKTCSTGCVRLHRFSAAYVPGRLGMVPGGSRRVEAGALAGTAAEVFDGRFPAPGS
ncbi:hypothetical protein HMSSN139_42320 [Paenibacillus sp. HMSSN-139]|nr:hypothetical protein HMSSN139_42320 [Paenibacillus sp. HMSSN-139]